MASSTSPDTKMFEESQVSSSISPDESTQFLKEHGIFYQANAEIGALVSRLDSVGLAASSGLDCFKPYLLKDPRIKQILEPFLVEPPSFQYTFGSDPGHYFVSTISKGEDHRLVVYMWSAESYLKFLPGSHKDSKGVPAANGMFETPKPFIKKKGWKEITVLMKEGGIAILHPRLVYQAIDGFSSVFRVEESQRS